MAAIIFDFDGTIANSFSYVADFLAQEAGLSPLSEEQKLKLHGLPLASMARQLGYRRWQLPGLFLKGRLSLRQVIKQLKPFEGMPEVIYKLHAEGHELFIVSSNTVRNIHTFLRVYQLQTYFLQIDGGISVFGKAAALRKLVREHNLAIKNCVCIGDELRDVEAAQSLGLPVIAVTWGFARSSDLAAAQPTALAHAPNDIIRILEEM